MREVREARQCDAATQVALQPAGGGSGAQIRILIQKHGCKMLWMSRGPVCEASVDQPDTDESFSAGTAPPCQQVVRVCSVGGNLVLMISVFLLKGLQDYSVC